MPEWKSFRKRQPIAFKRTRVEDIWKFLRQLGFSENNFDKTPWAILNHFVQTYKTSNWDNERY